MIEKSFGRLFTIRKWVRDPQWILDHHPQVYLSSQIGKIETALYLSEEQTVTLQVSSHRDLLFVLDCNRGNYSLRIPIGNLVYSNETSSGFLYGIFSDIDRINYNAKRGKVAIAPNSLGPGLLIVYVVELNLWQRSRKSAFTRLMDNLRYEVNMILNPKLAEIFQERDSYQTMLSEFNLGEIEKLPPLHDDGEDDLNSLA
jgi:hypothetical protein